MNDFLPKGYEVPAKSSSYMKLAEGDNRLRIMGSPILGWLWWETGSNGTRRPVRIPMGEKVPANVPTEGDDRLKHFWALVVWNYQEEQMQILEITQASIQRKLRGLANDADWGDPKMYDIVIHRTGQKFDTEYEVVPKPAKLMDPGIVQVYRDMHINLGQLFKGKDPFADEDEAA